jgi:co-chaperonin GroES (HSP10)
MPYMVMEHEVDPKQKLKTDVGDLSGVELFHNQILVAVYIRPQKTKSGLYLSDKTTDEDRYQSKVGMLLKSGPRAFEPDDSGWFTHEAFTEGDWLVFRPSDGWPVTVNGVLCRILQDVQVRGRIDSPDRVW